MKLLKRKNFKISFLIITIILLLSSVNSIFAIGANLRTQGVTVNLENEEEPIGYVAIIPNPGTYTTFSIDGSNQGLFNIMNFNDFKQAPEYTLNINDPGEDISLTSYPEYFNGYIMQTETSNNYVNPRNTRWLNMSAYNAEADTLDPFRFSSVYDYHTMGEAQELSIQLIDSIPLQIDLNIQNPGPKVLKVDWLLPNPNENPLDNYYLRHPNGKQLSVYYGVARDSTSLIIFRYFQFIASVSGTYRLLLEASPSIYPSNVILDFLGSQKFSAPIGGVTLGGSGGSFPSADDLDSQTWTTEWFIVSGSAGQKAEIDIGVDYEYGTDYTINYFIASNGDTFSSYNIATDISDLSDIYPIIFSKTAKVYFSISGTNLYRLSMTVRSIGSTFYKIGNDLTVRTFANQREAIHFFLGTDSFVRFNFTSIGSGVPDLDDGVFGTSKSFTYSGSRNLNLVHRISPIEQITDNGEVYYYYYMPAGGYHALISNTVPNNNGNYKISSRIIEHYSPKIPINDLTFPERYPSEDLLAEFDSFEDGGPLKKAQWFDLDIRETGQYRFNITMLADDYSPILSEYADPSYVLTYNNTSDEYIDVTSKALTVDETFIPMENVNDRLLMAFPEKWHDIHFNISQLGSGGGWATNVYVWTGSTWEQLTRISDETGELQTGNGSYVFDITDPQFKTWRKGADFNVSYISNESSYYWLYFICDNNYNIEVPYIDLVELSNITIIGDFDFYLVGKSGYSYSDFWTPPQIGDITNVIINQENQYKIYSTENWFSTTSDPLLLDMNEGPFKLLVIPNGWSTEHVKLRLSIENNWNYRAQETFNINSEPNLYWFQINNYTDTGYGFNNESHFAYRLNSTYNHTEVAFPDSTFDESYFSVECTGKAFAWTQLVVSMRGVDNYELYLLQDLPWENSAGPSDEVITLRTTVGSNSTYEFGVHSAKFTLLFEIENAAEMINFKIDINQYDTPQLRITSPLVSAPIDAGLVAIIVLGVSIGIVALVGIGFYFFRKRGGIRTKSPR